MHLSDSCSFAEVLWRAISKHGLYIWTSTGTPLFMRPAEDVDVQSINTVYLHSSNMYNFATGLTVVEGKLLANPVLAYGTFEMFSEFPPLFKAEGSLDFWEPVPNDQE